ncbi:hypothetical protein BJ165DRAFT_1535339 [Panaeolus papilionaceus]|nr:hypothetical protein BJ165DRAFT_1535339 [Panaeolus papilionaceus]
MSSFTYDKKKFFQALNHITRFYKEGIVTNKILPNFVGAQPSLDYLSRVLYDIYHNGLKVSGAVQQALGEHTPYWALEVAEDWTLIKDQAQSSTSPLIVDEAVVDRWMKIMQDAERKGEVETKGEMRKRKAKEMIQKDDAAGVCPNGTGGAEREPQKKKQRADGGGNKSPSQKDPIGSSETPAASNARDVGSLTKGHKPPVSCLIQDEKKGKSKEPLNCAAVPQDDSEYHDADGSDSATEEEANGKGRQAQNRKTKPKADHKRQYRRSEHVNDPPCERCRDREVRCNRVETGGGSCFQCATSGKSCDLAFNKKAAGRQGAANRLQKSEPVHGVIPKAKRTNTMAALEKRIAALETSLQKSEAFRSALETDFEELQNRMDVLEADCYHNAHLLGLTARDYRTTTIAHTLAIYQAARDATFAVQQAKVLSAAARQRFVPYPTTIKSCARYKHMDPPVIHVNGGVKTYGGDRPAQYITRIVRFLRSNSAEHQLERDVEEEFVPDPEDYEVYPFVDIADKDRQYKVAPLQKVASMAEGSINPPFQPVKVSAHVPRRFHNNDASIPAPSPHPTFFSLLGEDEMDVDIGMFGPSGSERELYCIQEGEEGWEMSEDDDVGQRHGFEAVGGPVADAQEKNKDSTFPDALEAEEARGSGQEGEGKKAAGCSDERDTSAGTSGEGGGNQAAGDPGDKEIATDDQKVQVKASTGGSEYEQAPAAGQKGREEETAAASHYQEPGAADGAARPENAEASTKDGAGPKEAAVCSVEQDAQQQQGQPACSVHEEATTLERAGIKLSPPKTAAAHHYKPYSGFDTDEPLTTPDQSESELEVVDKLVNVKPGLRSVKRAASSTRALRPRPAKSTEQKPADQTQQATRGNQRGHIKRTGRKGSS